MSINFNSNYTNLSIKGKNVTKESHNNQDNKANQASNENITTSLWDSKGSYALMNGIKIQNKENIQTNKSLGVDNVNSIQKSSITNDFTSPSVLTKMLLFSEIKANAKNDDADKNKIDIMEDYLLFAGIKDNNFAPKIVTERTGNNRFSGSYEVKQEDDKTLITKINGSRVSGSYEIEQKNDKTLISKRDFGIANSWVSNTYEIEQKDGKTLITRKDVAGHSNDKILNTYEIEQNDDKTVITKRKFGNSIGNIWIENSYEIEQKDNKTIITKREFNHNKDRVTNTYEIEQKDDKTVITKKDYSLYNSKIDKAYEIEQKDDKTVITKKDYYSLNNYKVDNMYEIEQKDDKTLISKKQVSLIDSWVTNKYEIENS